MHDLTFTHAIIERIKKELGGKELSSRVVVDVYLSPLSHVTPEHLQDIFDLVAVEQGLVNASLSIHIAEFEVSCKQCHKKWKSARPVFKCPQCAGGDFELGRWEEFSIGAIHIPKNDKSKEGV